MNEQELAAITPEVPPYEPGPPTAQGYERQIVTMARRARSWRTANPNREALVQFNIPPKAYLVQPISEALKMRTVSTNEAGLQLIQALWPWDRADEPTVNMVRFALEVKEI